MTPSTAPKPRKSSEMVGADRRRLICYLCAMDFVAFCSLFLLFLLHPPSTLLTAEHSQCRHPSAPVHPVSAPSPAWLLSRTRFDSLTPPARCHQHVFQALQTRTLLEGTPFSLVRLSYFYSAPLHTTVHHSPSRPSGSAPSTLTAPRPVLGYLPFPVRLLGCSPGPSSLAQFSSLISFAVAYWLACAVPRHSLAWSSLSCWFVSPARSPAACPLTCSLPGDCRLLCPLSCARRLSFLVCSLTARCCRRQSPAAGPDAHQPRLAPIFCSTSCPCALSTHSQLSTARSRPSSLAINHPPSCQYETVNRSLDHVQMFAFDSWSCLLWLSFVWFFVYVSQFCTVATMQ